MSTNNAWSPIETATHDGAILDLLCADGIVRTGVLGPASRPGGNDFDWIETKDGKPVKDGPAVQWVNGRIVPNHPLTRTIRNATHWRASK